MKKGIVLVLFFLIFVFNANGVMAEEMKISSDSAAVGATQSSTPKIEYNFVYPGILPDNPLYFLKTMRDRVVSILISDKLKRAEFDLLASDKRLVAASQLAKKNNDALAITTLSKSNNYMDQVVVSLAAAKKAGQNIDTVFNNTKNSIIKHKEEAVKMKKSIDKELLPAFNSELERLDLISKAASKISPK